MATTAFVTKDGDLARWDIVITNNGSQPDSNVVVTGVIPDGMVHHNANVPAGTSLVTGVSPTPYTWTVGDLGVGDANKKTLTVYTKVSNIFDAPFVWTWNISGDNTDSTPGNDSLVLTVESTTCPPTAGGSAQTVCGCVNLTGDTACSQCTTEWRLNLPSAVNLNVIDWDDAAGIGNFTHVDPTIDGTIEYNIWCTSCADASDYDTAGPYVLTLPALFTSDFDISGLEVHSSMAAAFASLGADKRFIWAEANTEGVSSPYASALAVSKNPTP